MPSKPADDAPFFNPNQARWVQGVLNMDIAVVGKQSLLGLILGQTQCEIQSLLRPARASKTLCARPSEN